MWCIQEITEEYKTRMYCLLALYKEQYDPCHPLVCMDEKSKQLLKDNRKPITANWISESSKEIHLKQWV